MMNLKELREKRKSISGIEKLTSAMKMVSQAKLAKVQMSWRQSRDITKEILELTDCLIRYGLLMGYDILSHIQKKRRYAQEEAPTPTTLLVLFSSDKGFCGAFNTRIARAAVHYIEQNPELSFQAVCVGKKSAYEVKKLMPSLPISDVLPASFLESSDTTGGFISNLYERYAQGDIQTCVAIYTKFYNSVRQDVCVHQILPFQMGHHSSETIHEASAPAELFEDSLPKFQDQFDHTLEEMLRLSFSSFFTNLTIENSVSEHSARMTAMDNASNNARKMIANLQLAYNSLRQASITRELVEIISGAQALEG